MRLEPGTKIWFAWHGELREFTVLYDWGYELGIK